MDKLAMNFTPFYIMANVRRILPAAYNRRTANWVLAMDIFAVGSNSGRQICQEAAIDPDGYTITKLPAKEPA
jgi:hypothetical protein